MKEYVVLIFTINVDDDWASDNIHDAVNPFIINIDSEDEDDIFLHSDEDQ